MPPEDDDDDEGLFWPPSPPSPRCRLDDRRKHEPTHEAASPHGTRRCLSDACAPTAAVHVRRTSHSQTTMLLSPGGRFAVGWPSCRTPHSPSHTHPDSGAGDSDARILGHSDTRMLGRSDARMLGRLDTRELKLNDDNDLPLPGLPSLTEARGTEA